VYAPIARPWLGDLYVQVITILMRLGHLDLGMESIDVIYSWILNNHEHAAWSRMIDPNIDVGLGVAVFQWK